MSQIHYHNYFDYGMHNATRRALEEISKYTDDDSLKDLTEKYTQSPVDPSTHIFCNVELDLQPLQAVGFDMDFTLAQVSHHFLNCLELHISINNETLSSQYNHDFDLLAFEGAKRNLVEKLGYPKEVLQFKYQ